MNSKMFLVNPHSFHVKEHVSLSPLLVLLVYETRNKTEGRKAGRKEGRQAGRKEGEGKGKSKICKENHRKNTRIPMSFSKAREQKTSPEAKPGKRKRTINSSLHLSPATHEEQPSALETPQSSLRFRRRRETFLELNLAG